MASISIVMRKKANRDGTFPLCLRLTKNRRSSYISLGKNIKAKDWDSKTSTPKSTYPNSKRLKNFLLSKLAHANGVLLEIETLRIDYSLKMLRERIVRKTNEDTFFKQSDIYFETMRKSGNYNRYSAEKGAISHFNSFVAGRDLAFTDVTLQLLEQFKAYLKGDKKVSERTAVNYLIIIRTIYNRAIKAGIVDQIYYPFGKGGMSLKRPESQKIGLDKDDVITLESKELDSDSFMYHARNVWLFSFYLAGIRASDTLLLRWSDIISGRLHYTMNKNLKSGSLKLPPKALAILDKYEDQKKYKDDLIFPDLKTVKDFKDKNEVQRAIKYRVKKLDVSLRKLGTLVGIDKPLTMHIARHTFGTISGDKIPIQKLQQLYRHSNITTTVSYQKAFLFKSTDEALDKVLDF